MRCVKAAVSVDAEVFKAANTLARRMKLSRSALFTRAVREFVARQKTADLIERINAACGDGPTEEDRQFLEAARRNLGEIASRDKW